MGGRKVAVVGAGRMGALLAHRMPGSFRKVIISRRKADAVALADEVGGVASDQYSAVRGCEVILLAVPGEAVTKVVSELAPHVDPNALLVNTATAVMTDDLAGAFPNLRFAAVKVVGDAQEMARGGPGAVLLDHVAEPEEELLRHLVSGLGPVARGRESVVMGANTAVVEVMARAETDLRNRLAAMGLQEPLVTAAIVTAGPGVLRSLAQGTPGPFARTVLARLRNSETAAP